MLYTARGEQFDLGWGPDPELRVHRSDTKHAVEEKKLSSWKREEHSVEVHLSNLGATEKIIEVVERVPVSEIDKVRIVTDAGRTSGGQTPDKDGFLRWKISLGGHAQKSLDLRYALKKHKAVVG